MMRRFGRPNATPRRAVYVAGYTAVLSTCAVATSCVGRIDTTELEVMAAVADHQSSGFDGRTHVYAQTIMPNLGDASYDVREAAACLRMWDSDERLAQTLGDANERSVPLRHVPPADLELILTETPRLRLSFSRPAISGPTAFIYAELQYCTLCGFGSYFILQRVDGTWTVTAECSMWVS